MIFVAIFGSINTYYSSCCFNIEEKKRRATTAATLNVLVLDNGAIGSFIYSCY